MRLFSTILQLHRRTAAAMLIAVTLGCTAPTLAAPCAETTVIPLGNATIKKGVQELSLRLSSASQDQMVQPLVFIAAQPQLPPAQPVTDPDNPPPPGPQVPATLSIEIGGKALPDWVLSPEPTAYVINVDAIRTNPEFAAGRLRAKMHLKTDADAMGAAVLGMPDPLLLDKPNPASINGPLADFARDAVDPEIRDFFQTMIDEFAGRQDEAFKSLRRLCNSTNEDVARLARRSTRRLAYLRRETTLSGNFLEHYRWGLYLEFCGLYRPAYDEFEECRVIYPQFADTQYRAGECFEIIGSDLMGLLQYIDRCEAASPSDNQTRVDLLAVIIRSNGVASLSDADVVTLMDHLTITRKMIAAATGNALKLDVSVQLVGNEKDLRLVEYPGGVMGPERGKFERSGWFDGVLTIRPASPAAPGANVLVSPSRAGPRGTTAACASSAARWPDFLDIVYQIVMAAGAQSEALSFLPPAADTVTVGIGPSPQVGFSCRSALRYAAPRNAFAGVGVADLPLEESFLRAWRLDGPYPAANDEDILGGVSVADGKGGRPVVFDSSTIDFDALGNVDKPGRRRATAWVYVPSDQLVQMRVDQRQPIGIRINGQVVRTGSGFSAAADDDDLAPTFGGVRLDRGWNMIEVVLNSSGGETPKFRMSLLTPTGKPIGGLADINSRPRQDLVAMSDGSTNGQTTFKWDDVRDDWRRLLPIVNIPAATGVSGARLASNLGNRTGYVTVALPGHGEDAHYRKAPQQWKADSDRDVVFNNVLDWHREWCFVVDAAANGERRQLLFARPEAVDAIVYCLKEAGDVKSHFKDVSPGSRIIGRIEVPGIGCVHDLIVFDVWLGDTASWPDDEEDLISPFGEFVPNEQFIGPSAASTNSPMPAEPASTPGS